MTSTVRRATTASNSQVTRSRLAEAGVKGLAVGPADCFVRRRGDVDQVAAERPHHATAGVGVAGVAVAVVDEQDGVTQPPLNEPGVGQRRVGVIPGSGGPRIEPRPQASQDHERSRSVRSNGYVRACCVAYVPFCRGYRRMPEGSIVSGVAPDPGSWHFALMAIMWRGFGAFGHAPVSTRGAGKRGHSAAGSLAYRQPRVDSRPGVSRRGPVIAWVYSPGPATGSSVMRS